VAEKAYDIAKAAYDAAVRHAKRAVCAELPGEEPARVPPFTVDWPPALTNLVCVRRGNLRITVSFPTSELDFQTLVNCVGEARDFTNIRKGYTKDAASFFTRCCSYAADWYLTGR
jgi:hypothetical protein